jgi:hypothetical protein
METRNSNERSVQSRPLEQRKQWDPMKMFKSTTIKKSPQRQQNENSSQQDEPMHVSFAESNEVHYVLALDDYTAEEIYSGWYNGEEYDKIVYKCDKIIKKSKKGKANKYCTRGLERAMSPRLEAVERSKMEAYSAVLDEQEAQRKRGVEDPERIAEVYYFEASYQCQQEANEVAERDALAVKEYLSALAGNECLAEKEQDEDLEDSVALFEVKFGDEKGLTCAATTWDQEDMQPPHAIVSARCA